jgi:hypothetical protein
MHGDHQQQAKLIDDDVPLASIDLFVGIVSA